METNNNNPIKVTTIGEKANKRSLIGSFISLGLGIAAGAAVKEFTDNTPAAIATGAGVTIVSAEAISCHQVKKAILEDAEQNGYKVTSIKCPLFGKVEVHEEHV